MSHPPTTNEQVNRHRASAADDSSPNDEHVPEENHEKLGIQRFFDQLAQALAAGNADAVASLWEAPAFVIGDGRVSSIASPANVTEHFADVGKQYEARGITEIRPELLRLDWVSEDLVLVDVRWQYSNVDGETIGEESSTYTLMRSPGGSFKIRAILMRGTAE